MVLLHQHGSQEPILKKQKIAFIWENFGPTHEDRCRSVAGMLADEAEIIGIQIGSASTTYSWAQEESRAFRKVTLFHEKTLASASALSIAKRIVCYCLNSNIRVIFTCHYESWGIFLSSIILRAMGCRVFAMNDSKFDDYARSLPRELAKTLFYAPYNGAIAGSPRAKSYMRFLGFRTRRIELGYDTIDTSRFSRINQSINLPYRDREFVCICRLVEKKNLHGVIEAYIAYRSTCSAARRLHIYGDGPLRADIESLIARNGLSEAIILHGFQQTDVIAKALASALSLVLLSTEEQFGFVIAEAQSAAVPVIISENCGARDELIRTGVNGFVVEPDNAVGTARFMRMLSEQQETWEQMRDASARYIDLADSRRFAQAVRALAGWPEN